MAGENGRLLVGGITPSYESNMIEGAELMTLIHLPRISSLAARSTIGSDWSATEIEKQNFTFSMASKERGITFGVWMTCTY